MGQYFHGVILNSHKKNYPNKEKVKAWLSPYDYGNGAKLMEHSYIGNDYVSAFEALINKENMQAIPLYGLVIMRMKSLTHLRRKR